MKSFALSRRRFLRDGATAATVTCLSPGLLLGCLSKPAGGSSASADADTLEQALDSMSGLAPFTNHGPMAAEALVTLGRAGAVGPWVEAYKKRFDSRSPGARQKVTRENWREALGDGSRVTDWTEFFNRELKEAAWPGVLGLWVGVLVPGLAAAAAHGLIRTGHAVRSLSAKETELRRGELASGLGYWAAYYQPLPEAPNAAAKRLKPAEALQSVPQLPPEKRVRGSIMAQLHGLDTFPPFAPAADLVETTDDAGRFLSELTELFAAVYLKNVNQRNDLILIHTVTAATALRTLAPYLSPATTRRALRYGWQAAAALYSISGDGAANPPPEAREIKRDDLIDRAVYARDEHAIKFTEACLREYQLNPKQTYLQAAWDAVHRLKL